MSVGFFRMGQQVTAYDVPDDRHDWLVPVAQHPRLAGPWPDHYRAADTIDYERYVRRWYWWECGDQRWEGSCFVHESIDPNELTPYLTLVAYLCGYAKPDYWAWAALKPDVGESE